MFSQVLYLLFTIEIPNKSKEHMNDVAIDDAYFLYPWNAKFAKMIGAPALFFELVVLLEFHYNYMSFV